MSPKKKASGVGWGRKTLSARGNTWDRCGQLTGYRIKDNLVSGEGKREGRGGGSRDSARRWGDQAEGSAWKAPSDLQAGRGSIRFIGGRNSGPFLSYRPRVLKERKENSAKNILDQSTQSVRIILESPGPKRICLRQLVGKRVPLLRQGIKGDKMPGGWGDASLTHLRKGEPIVWGSIPS